VSQGWATAIEIGVRPRVISSRCSKRALRVSESLKSGSLAFRRLIFSTGAWTSAEPVITFCPSWLVQVQSITMCLLRGYFFWQVMVTVSVSPTRTGSAKCSDWSMYTVPGPGNWVPSTLEISAPPHMPWAMTSRSSEELAYSGSTWDGLMSPDMMAYIWMSSWRSVRTSVALSPISISSKVRFSMYSELLAWIWVMGALREQARIF
jgi:hypothetical protein